VSIIPNCLTCILLTGSQSDQ